MKFKIIFFIFLLHSCSPSITQKKSLKYIPYTSKGFALIYNGDDYAKKIVSRKLNNDTMEVAHNKLRRNSILKITNPETKKTVTLRVVKKAEYPNFFKILISEKVAESLGLNKDVPFVDIEERIKNKSFVAKVAVTHNEEKKVSNKAPVTEVKIKNISTEKESKNNKLQEFSILIGEFYSEKNANNLKDILEKKYVKKDDLTVKKLGKNKFKLFAGPYTSINTLKTTYFELNKYGFENLDIEKK